MELIELFKALGFPLWAGVVLWAAISVTKMVRDGLARVEASTVSFETRFAAHIAESDKRMALMEALLRAHDRELQELKVNTNGRDRDA